MSRSHLRTETSPWAEALSRHAGVELTVIHTSGGRLALRAGDAGIELRWPQRVAAETVEDFLERQRGWIDRQQARYAELRAQWQAARQWVAGSEARLLLFGQVRPLHWQSPASCGGCAIDVIDGSVKLVQAGPGESARRSLAAMALAQLHKDLAIYARALAAGAGLKARSLSYRDMRSLWGSCSVDGRIRLNSALVFVAPEVARYVLAHELAHLRVRDHSPRFWRVVEELVPDYHAQRAVLRRDHALLLRLGAWMYAPPGAIEPAV